ncbi:hypothetical protein [Phenylobacterium sp.]|uniref:hypothetical protein n=1 Tax=Phenylobacterium sp. TaxID=1871053 RepID=UPI0025DC64DF|nr:hypothetical protein [Phenylobacterium sp.]
MRIFTAALAASTVLLAGQPAAAAYLLIEAHGTAIGKDWNNALGGGVVNYAIPFRLVGTLDLSGIDPIDPTTVQGGSAFSPDVPVVTDAHVELGPFTLNMPGEYLGAGFVSPTVFRFSSIYGVDAGWTNVGIEVAFNTPIALADLRALPAGNLCLIGACSAGMNMQGFHIDGYVPPSLMTDVTVTYLEGEPQGVPSGPVPDPDVWALMVLGFGATGARLRRRARAVSLC